MSRGWYYKSSERWLKARQKYLTASEIHALVTDARKIKANKLEVVDSKTFAGVYSSKLPQSFDLDVYGAMARGHQMEPFAVADAKTTYHLDQLYHWDDCLIARGEMAFSPDALDIVQPPSATVCVVDRNDYSNLKTPAGVVDAPELMVEVKSYETKSFVQRLVTPKEKLDERWQVAGGMFVCPSITHALLHFYAPQADLQFAREYTRDDLAEELALVANIYDMWIEYLAFMDGKLKDTKKTKLSEFDIYNQLVHDGMV